MDIFAPDSLNLDAPVSLFQNRAILRASFSNRPGLRATAASTFTVRTIDGTDNNGHLGAANTQLLRLFDNAYADGFNTPRGGNFNASTLPNPRTISNIVVDQTASVTNFLNASDWIWQWGQFIDHDLDFNEASGNFPLVDIMFIDVPSGDPTFADGTQLPFIRVTAADGTGTDPSNPREVNNMITAFIDASSVYGSDEERAEFLRDQENGHGRLQMSLGAEGEEALLVLNDGTQENATGGTLGDLQFVAGDNRVNEQVGLTAVHTLFAREHNRLADQLFERLDAGDPALSTQFSVFVASHPDLSAAAVVDDFIYEAARKVVGAKIQAITYNEFLPLLIGEGTLADYAGYNPDVNPQVSTEFANAAFRLGHTLLNNQIRRVNGNGVTETALQDAFFTPQDVIDNGIETLLTGLIFQGAQEVDHQLVDGVRDFLFPAGSGGLDLAAVNIARGRDVGLPSYTAIYEELFDVQINGFADLGSEGLGLFSDAVVGLFEAAYDSVDQIDLWIGGISELPDQHGGLLGPTFSFFIADQFGRVRDGDGFFYLRDQELAQLEVLAPGITDTTLADVIRSNSETSYLVPDDVFQVPFENSILGDDGANALNGTDLDDLMDGFAGNDRLRGREGRDYLFGGDGQDAIFGNQGADKVFGGNDVDWLWGNQGEDTVVGGAGNDQMYGGDQNDLLEGQAGSDLMIGGNGLDTFVFRADLLNDGSRDWDRIQRFEVGDTLDFADYVAAGGTVTGTRVFSGYLRVDLNGEDRLNIYGTQAAVDAAEAQIAGL